MLRKSARRAVRAAASYRRMTLKSTLTVTLTAALVFAASPAAAEWDGLPWESLDAGAPRVVFDIAVLRPLGLVQSVVGVAAFAIFYPVSLLTGGSEDVTRACITGPFDQTFRRPLGE